jgi:thiol-disulfide isomerase/thioredoxin
MIRALPLAGALLLACASPGPRPPPVAGASLSVTALGLDGEAVQLGGPGEVRVIDLFASWCEPCRAQLPALGRLAEAHAGGGVAVVAVSFDEDRAALDRFLADVPVAVPVLWDRGGATIGPALRIQRLPTTLVVDRSGVIRHVHLGYDAHSEARLEQEVAGLLAER